METAARILMVSNYFESHRGGLDLIAGRLVRELVRRNENIRWVASDTTQPPIDGELVGRIIAVRVINFTEQWLGIPFPFPSPRAILQLGHAIRGSDAVLLQDSLYPICMMAFLFAQLWRHPVIIAQHVGIVPYRNRLIRGVMAVLNRVIVRPMLANADRVAFFSEITARYFAGIRRRIPAALIFTGVDAEVFQPATLGEKFRLRHAHGLDPERPLALFVGRFVEKKGLDILKQMARLRADVQWVFAGWGHLDPEKWELPNVFVFRNLSGPSLAPLYQASDVFVLPSKGEGFPLVIQEALACGLPVVTSAENATADAAAAPLLYPVPLDESDPEATASAFCREVDPHLANREAEDPLSNQRFQFASKRYSWSAAATAYLKLIGDAIFDAKQPRTDKRFAAGRP